MKIDKMQVEVGTGWIDLSIFNGDHTIPEIIDMLNKEHDKISGEYILRIEQSYDGPTCQIIQYRDETDAECRRRLQLSTNRAQTARSIVDSRKQMYENLKQQYIEGL